MPAERMPRRHEPGESASGQGEDTLHSFVRIHNERGDTPERGTFTHVGDLELELIRFPMSDGDWP